MNHGRDEFAAIEDGAVQRALEVADAAAHVEVDVDPFAAEPPAPHGKWPGIEERLRSERGQDGGPPV